MSIVLQKDLKILYLLLKVPVSIYTILKCNKFLIFIYTQIYVTDLFLLIHICLTYGMLSGFEGRCCSPLQIGCILDIDL